VEVFVGFAHLSLQVQQVADTVVDLVLNVVEKLLVTIVFFGFALLCLHVIAFISQQFLAPPC
jgi:hypothetical protein